MFETKSLIRCFTVLMVASVFLVSCGVSSLRLNNYSQLYSNDIVLHPEYRLYHFSNDSTALFFTINTANLLYARQEKTADFTSKIRLEVQVFQSLEDKFPRTSDSIVFVDSDNNQVAKNLIGSIRFGVPSGKNFICKIALTDLNRNTADVRFLHLYKEPELMARQAFLPFDARNGVPVVSRIIKNERALLVAHESEPVSFIRCLAFSSWVTPALPPFGADTGEAESMKVLNSTVVHDSAGYFPLALDDLGSVYYLQADSNVAEGTTFLKFSAGFPAITTGEEMIGPLRYLTTDEEYKAIEEAPNKKVAAENFWIKCSGSKERAREVIKRFYRRVEEANEYFTSYKEGWKTDRGMLYIIFGSPDGLYLKESGESWVYGQDASMTQINCVFTKLDNTFTENDFVLQRNMAFRPAWYAAVESWRTGRVFSL